MNIEQFARRTGRTIQDNAPAILTALGAAGVVTTAYLAGKAGVIVGADIEYFDGNNDATPMEPKTKLQRYWRYYIPAGLVGVTSIACIIAAHSVNSRRQAALISAVTLGETAFREYRDKMIEVVGEAKDHKIIDEVAKDKVASSDGSDIVVIEPGNVLCYDTLTGRFFASTMEKIRKAENDIGRKCINEMYASQNDFYRLLGIPAVAVGEELGWNNDNPMELQFTSLLENGEPCLAIQYRFQPKINYHKIW